MARVRRLLRRFALVAALLIGLVAFTAWLLRDHPRRLVEAALAEELGARVHLGRLEIEGLGAFVLHDLEVELQVEAWAIEAHIPRLFVQGDLREIQRGRFRAVRVGSSEITARRADGRPHTRLQAVRLTTMTSANKTSRGSSSRFAHGGWWE